MDTALLLPMGLVQIGSSAWQLPSLSPRHLLSYALLGASLSMILFSLSHKFGFLLLCLFVNGLFQAVVFPQCIAALALWYTDPHSRTTVLGVWGMSAALGGMVGTVLVPTIIPPSATVLISILSLAREDAIAFQAFAPSLKALPCAWPIAFLSDVHNSYRMTL
jgi:sugar phosphate permease